MMNVRATTTGPATTRRSSPMISVMGTLEGKVAIVTGAGRNVGLGIALALASAGADVAVLEIDVATGEETARLVHERGVRAIAVPCDVTDPASCESAVAMVVDE